MRFNILVIIVLLLYATPALGGSIFGQIVIERCDDNSDTNATTINATINIECDSNMYRSIIFIPGTYRINVSEEGRCLLSLKFGQHKVDFEIRSRPAAVRYDFILKEKSKGKYSLVRD